MSTKYRQQYLRENPGPTWPCDFCPDEVLSEDDLHVHHKDHDRSNDALENLGGAHALCHLRHHKAGSPRPDMKGKPRTDEEKAKISKALMGHATSEETRRRISLAKKGRKVIANRSRGGVT